jgi:predicted P-loop ATPase
LENALLAINQLGIDCRYDIFHDRVVVSEHQIGLRGDVLNNLENVALKVRQAVLMRFKFDPGVNYTFDALRLLCLDRVFDPVSDYLSERQWDGVPRIDSWLIEYCGARDTELNRAIGRKMLVAGVRRVKSPGCKFDYIIVLESEKQGIGKSTALKILAGGDKNFSDAEIIGLDKRDQQESIQGVWIYEIGELEGMAKSDVRHMKLFASKTVDAARPAYGRSRVDRPRRCIFVATTNEDTYLRDTTGNRRFWPVRLHGVIPSLDGKMMTDLAGIERDRDQLWAEAVAAEATGEPLVIPEALWPDAETQQQARVGLDPWADLFISELARRIHLGKTIDGKFAAATDDKGDAQWRISTDHLLSDILWLPPDRQTNVHTKRLAEVMRSLGWTRNEDPMRIGKVLKRGYFKPKAEEE